MLTIDGVFRETVRHYADSLALQYSQDQTWEAITYRELNTAVNTIAHGLVDLGVGPESNIAIMCENRPEWIVSYLAIATTGSVAVPIDAVLGEIETEHILKHSGAQTVICSMRSYEVISRVLSNLPKVENIIILDRNITIKHNHKGIGEGKDLVNVGKKNHHKQFFSYDDIREAGRKKLGEGEIEFREKNVDDLASIIYTSGTTGSPKGVMLTHRNFVSNLEMVQQHIIVYENDKFLMLLPLHHAFPFTTCFLLPMIAGAAISFVDILSRDRTRLIMECQPTIMVGVPLLYTKIYRGVMRQVETSKVKSAIFKYGGRKIIGRAVKKKLGGKLRLMVSGAAPMDPEIIKGLVGLGIEFMEGYGLTETSPVTSANPLGNIKVGSVGVPLKGVEMKVLSPDAEGNGELLIKGGHVMQGYYKNPGQTAKVLKDNWFYTGDLGYIDSDGFVFITGRAKDVIVTRGGKNVFPEGVENIINKSEYIEESIVLGYKTKGLVGEDVGVLVYPDYPALIAHAEGEGITFEEPVDLEQLTADAKDEIVERFRSLLEYEVRSRMDKLASYQRVTRIGIERDEFTKTSTRKIKRFLYTGRLDIVDIK